MKRTSLSNIEVLLQEVKFHLEKYEVILLCIILFFFSGTESLIKEPQLPEDMRAGYEELEQNRANKWVRKKERLRKNWLFRNLYVVQIVTSMEILFIHDTDDR